MNIDDNDNCNSRTKIQKYNKNKVNLVYLPAFPRLGIAGGLDDDFFV